MIPMLWNSGNDNNSFVTHFTQRYKLWYPYISIIQIEGSQICKKGRYGHYYTPVSFYGSMLYLMHTMIKEALRYAGHRKSCSCIRL